MQTKRFVIVSTVAGFTWLAACGQPQPVIVQQQPSGYVQVQQVQQYDPYYDPTLALIYLSGHAGYYDHSRVFHETIIINGASGYRDSGGRFVSASPAVRDAAAAHKPFYGGTAGNSSTVTNPQGLNGTMGRTGAAQSALTGNTTATKSLPAGSFNSSAYRSTTAGSSTSGTRFGNSSVSAPVSSRPSYGSSSSSSSRPSYGSRK